MFLDATPTKIGLPKRIDCCVDGCMLFYDNEYGKNDGELLECNKKHKHLLVIRKLIQKKLLNLGSRFNTMLSFNPFKIL